MPLVTRSSLRHEASGALSGRHRDAASAHHRGAKPRQKRAGIAPHRREDQRRAAQRRGAERPPCDVVADVPAVQLAQPRARRPHRPQTQPGSAARSGRPNRPERGERRARRASRPRRRGSRTPATWLVDAAPASARRPVQGPSRRRRGGRRSGGRVLDRRDRARDQPDGDRARAAATAGTSNIRGGVRSRAALLLVAAPRAAAPLARRLGALRRAPAAGTRGRSPAARRRR